MLADHMLYINLSNLLMNQINYDKIAFMTESEYELLYDLCSPCNEYSGHEIVWSVCFLLETPSFKHKNEKCAISFKISFFLE